MLQELVYTSVPKGLKLGSSGFCTVATSPGMAQNLATFLESLSGYRHLNEPGAPGNPINYSHLRHRIGAQEYSILSRISDAGFDYSNRSNKLAHHLAIPAGQALTKSPVAILASDVMYSRWDQPPTKLNDRTIPNLPPLSPKPCSTWGNCFGDDGWAGAALEAIQSGRNVSVIFDPNFPTLQLIQEALALLPVEQQWDVTFSTFFTRLPPRVECKLRFVVDGSDEAAAARRNRNGLTIEADSSTPLSESRFTQAAREGTLLGSGIPSGRTPTVPLSGGQESEPVPMPPAGDSVPYVDEEYAPEPVPIRKSKNVPNLPGERPRPAPRPVPASQSVGDLTTHGSSGSRIWIVMTICLSVLVIALGTISVLQLMAQNNVKEISDDKIADLTTQIQELNKTIETNEKEIENHPEKVREAVEVEKTKLANKFKIEQGEALKGYVSKQKFDSEIVRAKKPLQTEIDNLKTILKEEKIASDAFQKDIRDLTQRLSNEEAGIVRIPNYENNELAIAVAQKPVNSVEALTLPATVSGQSSSMIKMKVKEPEREWESQLPDKNSLVHVVRNKEGLVTLTEVPTGNPDTKPSTRRRLQHAAVKIIVDNKPVWLTGWQPRWIANIKIKDPRFSQTLKTHLEPYKDFTLEARVIFRKSLTDLPQDQRNQITKSKIKLAQLNGFELTTFGMSELGNAKFVLQQRIQKLQSDINNSKKPEEKKAFKAKLDIVQNELKLLDQFQLSALNNSLAVGIFLKFAKGIDVNKPILFLELGSPDSPKNKNKNSNKKAAKKRNGSGSSIDELQAPNDFTKNKS